MNIKKIVRHIICKRLKQFLIKGIILLIQWEALMGKQDDCKHEGQSGVYCGLCGKQMKDPDQEEFTGAVRAAVRAELEEAGIIKKKEGAGEKKSESLYERVMKKKEKK